LWDIAWNELGEPERWPELYEASRRIQQPDGRHMTDPDLIYPGWIVRIPTSDVSSVMPEVTEPELAEPRQGPPSGETEPPALRTPLSALKASRTEARNVDGEDEPHGLRTPLSPQHPSSATPATGIPRWTAAVAAHDIGIRVSGQWRQAVGGEPPPLI
jgi:hypothetical protein